MSRGYISDITNPAVLDAQFLALLGENTSHGFGQKLEVPLREEGVCFGERETKQKRGGDGVGTREFVYKVYRVLYSRLGIEILKYEVTFETFFILLMNKCTRADVTTLMRVL